MEENRAVSTLRSAVDIQNCRVFLARLIVLREQHPAVNHFLAISFTVILRSDIFGIRDIFAPQRRGVEVRHRMQASLPVCMIDLLQLHIVHAHHPQIATHDVKVKERALLMNDGLYASVKPDPPDCVAGAVDRQIIHVVPIRFDTAPAAVLNVTDHAEENALIRLTKQREILLRGGCVVKIEKRILILPVSLAFASQNDELVLNFADLHDMQIRPYQLRAASGRKINPIQSALVLFPVLNCAADHIGSAADHFKAVNGEERVCQPSQLSCLDIVMEQRTAGALGNPLSVKTEWRIRQLLIVLILLDLFEDLLPPGFRQGVIVGIFRVGLPDQQIISVRLFSEIRHGNREFIGLFGFASSKSQALEDRDRLLLALLFILAPLCREKDRIIIFEKELSRLPVRNQLHLCPALAVSVSSEHEQIGIVIIVLFIDRRDNISKLVALRRQRHG